MVMNESVDKTALLLVMEIFEFTFTFDHSIINLE